MRTYDATDLLTCRKRPGSATAFGLDGPTYALTSGHRLVEVLMLLTPTRSHP